MRFRIYAFLIAGFFITLLLSCDIGNNISANELSKKKQIEISELKKQIEDIDAQISSKIRLKSLWGNDDELLKGITDSKISELKSKREILVIKLRVLYEAEQKY